MSGMAGAVGAGGANRRADEAPPAASSEGMCGTAGASANSNAFNFDDTAERCGYSRETLNISVHADSYPLRCWAHARTKKYSSKRQANEYEDVKWTSLI